MCVIKIVIPRNIWRLFDCYDDFVQDNFRQVVIITNMMEIQNMIYAVIMGSEKCVEWQKRRKKIEFLLSVGRNQFASQNFEIIFKHQTLALNLFE